MPDFYLNKTSAFVSDEVEITGDFIVEVLGDLKGGAAELTRSQTGDEAYSPVVGSALDQPGHYAVTNIGTSSFKGVFKKHNPRLGTPNVTMRYTQ